MPLLIFCTDQSFGQGGIQFLPHKMWSEFITSTNDKILLGSETHRGYAVGGLEQTDGQLAEDYGDGGFSFATPTHFNYVGGMAAGRDGTIVLAAGAPIPIGESYDTSKFSLVRFLPHGRLDLSFGQSGFVYTDLSNTNRK